MVRKIELEIDEDYGDAISITAIGGRAFGGINIAFGAYGIRNIEKLKINNQGAIEVQYKCRKKE